MRLLNPYVFDIARRVETVIQARRLPRKRMMANSNRISISAS